MVLMCNYNGLCVSNEAMWTIRIDLQLDKIWNKRSRQQLCYNIFLHTKLTPQYQTSSIHVCSENYQWVQLELIQINCYTMYVVNIVVLMSENIQSRSRFGPNFR